MFLLMIKNLSSSMTPLVFIENWRLKRARAQDTVYSLKMIFFLPLLPKAKRSVGNKEPGSDMLRLKIKLR